MISASTKIITTFAGTGGSAGPAGDNGAATSAQLDNIAGLSVDTSGNLYISDRNSYRIRKVTGTTRTTDSVLAQY